MPARPSALLVSIVSVVAGLVGARLFNDFPPSEVHSLNDHASIVINDQLYIDGGGFTSYQDGGQNTTYRPTGKTIAVDLSQAWDAQTVPSVDVSSGFADKSGQYLFYSRSDDSLYRFGGYFSDTSLSSRSPGLDVLSLQGIGQKWEHAVPPKPKSIPTPFFSLAARASDSLYLLGGLLEITNVKYQYVPGMIEYTTSTEKWTEISSDDYLHGFGGRGSGVYLPNFGDEGILIFLGGYDPIPAKPRPGHTTTAGPIEFEGTYPEYANMSQISVYDIASKKFLTQTATAASGTPPRGRDFLCAAAVQDSQSGESDIFMYGGATSYNQNSASDVVEASMDSASVWVLSLPSFQWSKVYEPGTGEQGSRLRHTCEVLNGRQLAVIGGRQAFYFPDLPLQAIPVGPYIFDMTALNWRDGYDPNLGPYVRSKVLVENSANQPVPPQWDNTMLKNIFVPKPTPTPTPTPKPTPSPAPSSSNNTGVIAGAAAGGAVALILAALLLWWFCFRKRKSGSKSQSTDDEAGTKPPAYRDVPGETLEKEPKAGATEVLQTPSSPTGTNLSDAGRETVISQNSQASELIAGPIPWRLPSGEYGGLSPNAEPVELMGTPTAFELSSASLRVTKAQRNEGNADNERHVIE